MAETSEHINDSTIEQPKGGATKATRGRPPAEFYSSSMHTQPSFSVAGNYYHERCLQLEGQLNDANRKNQQITDELFQARKDLSQDKTELLLAHQNEIARLKEEFRDKVDQLKDTYHFKINELEKKIEHLDREQFKKDLEYQTAQQSTANKIADQFIKSSPDFIGTIGDIISIIAGPRHGMGPTATFSQDNHQGFSATRSQEHSNQESPEPPINAADPASSEIPKPEHPESEDQHKEQPGNQ